MKKQYRIIDEVDTKIGLNQIRIESRRLIDRIFCFGWWYEKSIVYDNDKSKYPHKTCDEAILEAEQWIEDVQNSKRGVTKTLVEVI